MMGSRFEYRELGDIKALLLADRAQRRQLNGAAIRRWKSGNTNTGPPKLLGSAEDRSSTGSSGSGGDSSASGEQSVEDDEELPPRPMLTPREVQVLELVTEGYTNRSVLVAIYSARSFIDRVDLSKESCSLRSFVRLGFCQFQKNRFACFRRFAFFFFFFERSAFTRPIL